MLDKLKDMNKAAAAYVMALLAMAPGGLDWKTDMHARQMGNRGQLGLGTVLAALVVVIAVSLAVIVVDRFDSSLGNPSSSSLSTAQNDVLTGFSDMTSLIGPLLLVAIAVVIIGLIRRVQGSA
jgi:hypothetical protein